MAKTLIHTQQEALSVYFQDMLNAPFQPAVDPVTETPTAFEPELKPENQTVTTLVTPEQTVATVTPNAAAKPGKYLFCDVAGLPIALELLSLNNIILWPEDGLISVPGQPEMVMGLLNQRGQQTLVLDMNMLLHKEPPEASQRQYKFLLLFDERRHAIACDHIDQILLLTAEHIDVVNRPQQPWYTGVASEQMHSIIDLSVILQRLLDEE